jgi:hypothetical protein
MPAFTSSKNPAPSKHTPDDGPDTGTAAGMARILIKKHGLDSPEASVDPTGPDTDGPSDDQVAAAHDFLQAVKSGDALGVAHALRDFNTHSGNDGDDDTTDGFEDHSTPQTGVPSVRSDDEQPDFGDTMTAGE